MRLALCLIAPLLVGAASPSYRYQIDTARSDVSAKVGFFGIASKTARFPQMTGQIALAPERLDTIDLDVEIDARRLTAGVRVRLRIQSF